MVYLKKFNLLSDVEEHYAYDERTIFNSFYPFHIFPQLELETLEFDDVTIICGGNGSGKSTLLNIIASKIEAQRINEVDKGALFKSYVDRCSYEMAVNPPMEKKAITSDDVFDYLLDIRAINTGVNRRKDLLAEEFLSNRFSHTESHITDYEAVKAECEAKAMSMSKYIRKRLVNNNIVEQSNGQSALMFWEKEIKENGIYILDEPENSLSALNQLKLKEFIEESRRFFNCQFIISTHSPFLLAIEDAKIYDLDSIPVAVKNWTDIPNVKIYRDFFKEHEDKFEA